ncbi:calcium-binding protein [Salinicola salarius]|uniref:calcium-binding protein n=1 Tax=Salinicola salarius TaxID=430457 RepID=UPI000DA1EB29|nr:alginate biosynthesis protein [Salinicola salarius]MDF3918691.1 alginate biosynthesis protein [Salinicola salarius]
MIRVDNDVTAEELEQIINEEANRDETVKLEAGEYRFDHALTITRSDVSLVGEGSDDTRLTFTDAALEDNDDNAILVTGETADTIGKIESDVDEGENVLKLDDAGALAAGDTIRIAQDNDTEFLDEIDDHDWRELDSPLRTSMAKVTDVDGDYVTLDRGVHFDFDHHEAEVTRIDSADDVSLRGFSVGFELGEPDDDEFSNELDDLTGYHAIEYADTTDGELDDVAVIDGPSTAFEFSRSLDMDADSLTTEGSFNKGSGGNGYAFELRESYDGTFDDLSDSGMRHGLLFASWHSSVGNDVEVTRTDRDINFHGGRDHDNRVHVQHSVRDPDNDKISSTLWVNEGESFGAPTDMSTNDVTFDDVVGSRRDDIVRGSDDGVTLFGGTGSDTLFGGDGDDVLAPGSGWGQDWLDGGDGHDIARMEGNRNDYAVDRHDDRVTVDGNGIEATLVGIQELIFDDGGLSL